MKKWWVLVLLFIPFCGYSQTIVTIAGNGSNSTTGDGGPATAAHVANPSFGSFDAAGNYYFSEGFSSTGPRIRMINMAGIITTVAGNGSSVYSGDGIPATAAGIPYPVANVDAIGNIYIADYYSYRVRKVDVVTGIIHTIAGNGTNSSTGDGGPATAATIIPTNICTDGIGNVFVSDNSGNIRKIDAVTGIISHVASIFAEGMCFDALGNLYIGSNFWVFKIDTATGVIDTIGGTGAYLYNGDGIPATAANIRPYDITRDHVGNIYIADYLNNRVRMIDPVGNIHTIAGNGIAGYSSDGGSC